MNSVFVLLEPPTAGTNQRCRQTLAAFAHEADLPGRITHDHGVWRNVPDDDRTRTNEGVAPNPHPADDSGVGTDGSAFRNIGCHQLLAGLLDLGAWIEVVSEYGIRPDKHVIAQ